MTKWIVGLLLLANLILFGWMRWGSLLTVDTDTGTVQAALNPDKIKLLETLASSAVAPVSSTTPGMSLTLSPVSAPTVSAPLVVATPAPTPVFAPTLVLTPKPAPVTAVTAPSNATTCAEWGEFSGEDLSRAQQALTVLKLGDTLTQRGVEKDHGYWVYIPPLKKRAAVEQKIAELKERGVKDYFVVQEKGKWLNAISLGVFKSKESAQKYIEMLRAKDVRSAKLGERMSKLKFTVFIIMGLDTGTTDKLKALQKEFPDSELKVSACSN